MGTHRTPWSRWRAWPSARLALGLLLGASALTSGAAGCSRCGGDQKPPEPAVVAEPPVSQPEGLVADLVVPTPNASWGKLQRGVGGAMGILPSTLGGLVCAFAALDAGLGPEIDGTAPAHGVLAGEPAHPSWALAFKLVDMRKARAMLLDGDVARFTAKDLGTMTELVSRGAPPPVSVALTRGGYLLVASDSDALTKLGPYASRTLPTRAVPTSGAAIVEVPGTVFARVKPWALRTWHGFRAEKLDQDEKMRAAHGGREPDFADPKAIVSAIDDALVRKLDVVGDLARATLALDVGDKDVRARLELVPNEGEGAAAKYIASLETGDTAPLLDAPSDAHVVGLLREAAAARTEDAASWKTAIQSALGKRVSEAETKKIGSVVDDWTAGRGEALVVGAFGGGPRGLFARVAVNDANAASRSLTGVVDLASLPLVRDAAKIREVKRETTEVADVGKVQVALMERADAKGRGPTDPRPLGFAWRVGDGLAVVGLGESPADLLKHAAKPGTTIGEDATLKAALGAVRGEVTALVVVQPLLDPKRAGPPLPVVLGAGRNGPRGWVEVLVPDGVIREIARREIGL